MISLGQLLHSQSPLQGGNGRSFNADADKGVGTGPGNSDHIVTGRPAFSAHASSIQQFTVQDVQIAQKTVEHELKSKMDAQMALIKPEAAELLASEAPGSGFASDDFSPEAVTDRIMGFIESRIEAERANGASDEELQSMFGQAMKGLEQGLREAKEVITALDMFDGEVKDTFFETVSLLDERMNGLEKTLFGSEGPDGADGAVVDSVPRNLNTSVDTASSERASVKALDVERAFSSIPKGNERYAAQSNALFFSQDNQFDMEVVTQDGDKVTIHVGAGESLDFRSGSQVTPRGSVSGFALEQSNYYDISFSVEGDLDEGELAALNDLFTQVNDVADSFYSGNVGEAFEQALAVGYDSEELAAFAVNMTHSEVVAVAQTYKEVAAADQGDAVESENPLQSIMDRLSEFAAQVLASHDLLLDNPNKPSNQQALFSEILSELVPADDTGPQGEGEETAGVGEGEVVGVQIHDAFKGFIDGILG